MFHKNFLLIVTTINKFINHDFIITHLYSWKWRQRKKDPAQVIKTNTVILISESSDWNTWAVTQDVDWVGSVVTPRRPVSLTWGVTHSASDWEWRPRPSVSEWSHWWLNELWSQTTPASSIMSGHFPANNAVYQPNHRFETLSTHLCIRSDKKSGCFSTHVETIALIFTGSTLRAFPVTNGGFHHRGCWELTQWPLP